ncbi:MAG: hypothetical protein IPN26_00820 [Bacteroidetes bacterium]|nr:hypothetical protein [Bacteroidota bacterium]
MNTVTNFYSPTNNELIAAGDLYYDAPTQEVWFAGTCEKIATHTIWSKNLLI